LYRADNLLDRETALRLYTHAGAELTGEADRKAYREACGDRARPALP
jgi:hypothetical protein